MSTAVYPPSNGGVVTSINSLIGDVTLAAGTNITIVPSGNTLTINATGEGLLIFADSLVDTAGTVTLVGDTATPGASKYYGTNPGSVLGYYALPVGTISSLTGDVTASGSGAVAATVAKIQGTTVSGTTGTTNVVFSASPTLTGTAIVSAVKSGNYHLDPSENNAGSSGTALTVDLSTASAQKITLTGNVTLTLTNPQTGGAYVIKIVQGASAFTVTWPAAVKWPGGTAPVITTTNGQVDLINLYYDGTDYFGSFAQNYTP